MAFGDIIGRPHQGTHTLGDPFSDNAYDIALPIGTPLVAVADGRIGAAFGYNTKGGWRLHLITNTGQDIYYAHLKGYATGIFPGRRVKAGQVIGYSGDTGNARGTTPHLHIGGTGNIGQFIDDIVSGGRGKPLASADPNSPASLANGFAARNYFAGITDRAALIAATRRDLRQRGINPVQAQSLAVHAVDVFLVGLKDEAAVKAAAAAVTGTSFFSAFGFGGAEALGRLVSALADIRTWIRIAEVVGGVIILVIALRILMQGDTAIRIPGRG